MKVPLHAPAEQAGTRQRNAEREAHAATPVAHADPLDRRAAAATRRTLQESVDRSPHLLQRQARLSAIHDSPRAMAQRRQTEALFGPASAPDGAPRQLRANAARSSATGLPEQLKSGIEAMSGLSMDHVTVHYNSSRPAQMQAHAYAQGSDIHVGPGQEQHLPHEAWHVVQQAQGRVRPTMQTQGGVAINDDKGLEQEADVMGQQAMQRKVDGASSGSLSHAAPASFSVQRVVMQLKSKEQIKQDLKKGSVLADFTQPFIVNHVGSGNNTNMGAARVHANRPAPPPVNTVIVDAHDLKNKLSDGSWVDGGNHFKVKTAGTTGLQNTTRSGANIAAVPARLPRLKASGLGDEAEKFTVQDGAITAIEGAAEDEVAAATSRAGNYPTNPKKKKEKREYRSALTAHINQQRADIDSTVGADWVRANFSQIGATVIDATHTTEQAIDAIAGQSKSVKVFIDKVSGEIYHFAG